MQVLAAQSCPTLRPHGLQPARSSVCGILQALKNTGVGSHSLLQGIFVTQGSNEDLLHCRQIPYHLSHRGNEKGREAKDDPQDPDWNTPGCIRVPVPPIERMDGRKDCT